MVKNTIGGKKGKMLSKKQHGTNNGIFPISMNELEIYVCVIKIFGGGVFEVIDQENKKYKAYLRGKMKGSNKRHNLVSMFSILLVGIRFDLSDKSSVDILFVYENTHLQSLTLLSQFPNKLLYYMQNHNFKRDHDDDHDNILLYHNTDDHDHHNFHTQQHTNDNTNTTTPHFTLAQSQTDFDFNYI